MPKSHTRRLANGNELLTAFCPRDAVVVETHETDSLCQPSPTACQARWRASASWILHTFATRRFCSRGPTRRPTAAAGWGGRRQRASGGAAAASSTAVAWLVKKPVNSGCYALRRHGARRFICQHFRRPAPPRLVDLPLLQLATVQARVCGRWNLNFNLREKIAGTQPEPPEAAILANLAPFVRPYEYYEVFASWSGRYL